MCGDSRTHVASFLRSKAFLVAADSEPLTLLPWNTSTWTRSPLLTSQEWWRQHYWSRSFLTCCLKRLSLVTCLSWWIIFMRSQTLLLNMMLWNSYRAARSWWRRQRQAVTCRCAQTHSCPDSVCVRTCRETRSCNMRSCRLLKSPLTVVWCRNCCVSWEHNICY